MTSTLKPTFTYGVKYLVEAECKTPLRSGPADGDTESILQDHNHHAFLQGSSLAGALRSWTQKVYPSMVDVLFGNQKTPGHLIISDGILPPDAQQYVRPRLRIHPRTGAAEPNGKFDIAHLGAGCKFQFTVTWLGTSDRLHELEYVEQMLAALNGGQITLGAQKTNGFGRVQIQVQKQEYNLTESSGRGDWLQDVDNGKPLTLPKLLACQEVIFTVTGHADSILVQSAAAQHYSDSSYTGNLSEGGIPILPGSSVKGAVRARVSSIARFLRMDEQVVSGLFGRKAMNGDNGKQGRIVFEDVLLSKKEKRKITRIRINRFTGGVMLSGPFTQEPLSSDVTLRITCPAQDATACGLLLYALRDLGLGLYSLGSGASIGRGIIQVEEIRVSAPENREACLTFQSKEGNYTVQDDQGLLQGWIRQLGGGNREGD